MNLSNRIRPVLFLLFFVSGFAALLYQTVWLRLAFANFGIVTGVISIIVSTFMLGLSIGSWLGGKYIDQLSNTTKLSPILFYAIAELITALSAPIVPLMFTASSTALLNAGSFESVSYMLSSALLIGLSILPWCICMGTTYPFMMAYVKKLDESDENSFSHLYLGNVVGSAVGAVMTAFVLIELLGFRNTLMVAAGGNVFIALVSFALAVHHQRSRNAKAAVPEEPAQTEAVEHIDSADSKSSAPSSPSAQTPLKENRARGHRSAMFAILFITGFSSMGMEVAWVRAFLPVLGHAVYAFATLLFVYLCATAIGAYTYRMELKFGKFRSLIAAIALLALFSCLPVLFGDPRFQSLFGALKSNGDNTISAVLSLLSIIPFCFLLGYLTPKIIDEYSEGVPSRAGFAYAINVIGCILGPLAAGYILLPCIGARLSLVVLAVPYMVLSMVPMENFSHPLRHIFRVVAVAALGGSLFCTSYEEGFGKGEVVIRRDHVATVLQSGQGKDKQLFVNGVQMTALNEITKEVGHIPIWLHKGDVKKCLGICFGMGTSFRSQISYGVDTTWVELVPSVIAAFSYYHDDAEKLSKPSTTSRIICDDGRRFLQRTSEKFDIITVDAPPPPEASGVSLLFSDEFYKLAKTKLQPNGIVEVLIPIGDPVRVEAQLRSLADAFPYVRVFLSPGIAYVCSGSMSEMNDPTVSQIIERMPEAARADLIEWRSDRSLAALKDCIQSIKGREIKASEVLVNGPNIRISDDRPLNEYFILRSLTRNTSER